MRGAAVLALVLAGVVLSVPGRRPWAASTRPRGQRRGLGGATLRGLVARIRRPARPSVAAVLVEVAARLRAGSPMVQAWQRALPEPRPAWAAPLVEALELDDVGLAAPGYRGAVALGHPRRSPPPGGLAAVWRIRGLRARDGPDVAAATAACRLSARTGAPLAEVVDVVVAGIAETVEAENLRRAALAGPRATARLLAWLPLAGVGLGAVLGADPVAVLLGGGPGGLCLVGGLALFLLGRRWVRLLLRDAERAGR